MALRLFASTMSRGLRTLTTTGVRAAGSDGETLALTPSILPLPPPAPIQPLQTRMTVWSPCLPEPRSQLGSLEEQNLDQDCHQNLTQHNRNLG